MSILKQRLTNDVKEQLKQGNKENVKTLRGVLAAVKNVEIDTKAEATDAIVITELKRYIKNIDDELFEYKGKVTERTTLLQISKDLLIPYLPVSIPREEVESEVADLIAGMVEEGVEINMKTVMPKAMEKLSGRAENKVISNVVSTLIAAK